MRTGRQGRQEGRNDVFRVYALFQNKFFHAFLNMKIVIVRFTVVRAR